MVLYFVLQISSIFIENQDDIPNQQILVSESWHLILMNI